MFKKYVIYMFRWQLSTPLFAIILVSLGPHVDEWTKTVIANFIGALVFFWIDRFIFRASFAHPLWEIRDNITCVDCGKKCRGYRLVKTRSYDRLNDKRPEFRCEGCSDEKLTQLNETKY